MSDFLPITCPHCGEEFQIAFEPTDGTTEFITDCEVCCRPMTIKLRIVDGAVEDQDITAA